MLNKAKKWMVLIAAMLSLSGVAFAASGFSLSVGTNNFYASVGNYDYFPYAYSNYGYGGTPRINFYDVMSDYGAWNNLSPFGRVWRPYVSAGWRPYVQGHWIYTRYGPTWSGYEPWAWAGYHYGNWVWTQRLGWVWVPGYTWHPGRVIWSQGYNSLGWMPAPPHGYDYSRGYLDYRGGYNQFDYYDDDFGNYDDDYYDDYYGGGYNGGYYGGGYNSRYNDLFYGSGYRNIVVNLWIFIDTRNFGYGNYNDCYLDHNFTRSLFDRRLVRISSRPLQRTTLERVTRQRINEVPVREREIQTETRRVKLVVPEGEDQQIRKNADRVIKQTIAPAFAKERRNFKGLESKNANLVNKLFKQENKRPEIRRVQSEEIVQESKRIDRDTDSRRERIIREKSEQVKKFEEQRKANESKKSPVAVERKPETSNAPRESRDSQFERGRSNETFNKESQKDRESQFESKKSAPKKVEQEDRFRETQRRPENKSNDVRRYEAPKRPEPKSTEVRRYEPPKRPEPKSNELRRYEPPKKPEPKSNEVRRYEAPKRPEPRSNELRRYEPPKQSESRPQPRVEERRPQQSEVRRDSRSSSNESSKKTQESKQKNDSKKKDNKEKPDKRDRD